MVYFPCLLQILTVGAAALFIYSAWPITLSKPISRVHRSLLVLALLLVIGGWTFNAYYAPYLIITSPNPNTNVRPGDTIFVEVDVTCGLFRHEHGDNLLVEIVRSGDPGAATVATQSYRRGDFPRRVTLTLPQKLELGEYELQAIMRTLPGDQFKVRSTAVPVNVK